MIRLQEIMNTEVILSMPDRRIFEGGVAVGYFKNGAAYIDSAFFGCAIGKRLSKTGNIVKYRSGLIRELQKYDTEIRNKKKVRVFQLKPNVDPQKKFIDYGKLYRQYGGIDSSEYALIFEGSTDTDDPYKLYDIFNSNSLPKGYKGHRLSISDIIEIYDDIDSVFYYLDSCGFRPVEMERNEEV